MSDRFLLSKAICRTCLEPITDKKYSLNGILVFNADTDIASMLQFCTSSKLDESDELPDSVCLSCFKIIRISYRFLKQFFEVQKQLLELKEMKNSGDSENDFKFTNDMPSKVKSEETNKDTYDFLSFHNYTIVDIKNENKIGNNNHDETLKKTN